MNAIIGDTTIADQKRLERILKIAIDPYLDTPRDAVRLVNTLKVMWPNVAGDVDIADLIAITTLQLFDPDVYALIQSEIEILTNAIYRYENKEQFAERMTPRMARKPEVAKEAMALIFPYLAKEWKTFMADSTSYIVRREHRRISTK